MSCYFTHLKHIQHTFILDERVVWIEIGGLPLNAWTPNAFKKIAETYNVSVKDFAGWTPDIKSIDATSGYNSESDKSEKLEEALDENGPFDKEECEIPKDEPNEEHEFDINTQWADADPSHFLSALVKSSRVSKSQTKSFGNHGSMIEAFVSHIEMGKVLGYDMEDFNVVRWASKRFGTTFNHASANAFNRFIRDAQLWDVPLGGHMFTRFNKHGDKLSKLDRFLISESLAPSFQKFTGHVLDSLISDHRPIMLSHLSNDFGPTPFKFYNSWLLDKSLLPALIDFWENYIYLKQDNPIVSFKNKMKTLKVVIKEWNLKRKGLVSYERDDLIKKIKDFDSNIVSQNANFPVDSHRAAWIDRLRVIDFNVNVDASQKA
nr:RNA-directed DNA polymerase, eukaryota, reverse transcriptase zinc-binding domain protein [Tanacetum cinerariifolium]